MFQVKINHDSKLNLKSTYCKLKLSQNIRLACLGVLNVPLSLSFSISRWGYVENNAVRSNHSVFQDMKLPTLLRHSYLYSAQYVLDNS